VDVDNTPPVWFGEEARLAPARERLADFFRWATYRRAQRAGFDPGIAGYLLLGVLAGILIRRLARAKRATRRAARTATDSARVSPGYDSELYAIERALLGRVPPRRPGTPLGAWASQVACTMDEALRADLVGALQLHTRHRFDPEGSDERERARLRDTVRRLVEAIRAEHAPERDGSPPGKEPRSQDWRLR
jgi:hypothetical protein